MDRKKTHRRLRNTGKSVHLPQELIEEILSALPAKSLLRFKCVSKSWRCLIGSDRFIKTQLEKSTNDPSYAHCGVTFDWSSDDDDDPEEMHGMTQCSARTYLDENDPYIHRRPFGDSTNNHLTTTDCKTVGHCNGLLCILKKRRFLFLWNPTIRMSIELPKLKLSYKGKYGFGMDEQTGEYKVFAAFNPLHEGEDGYIGKVYSSKTKSWKTVEHGCLDVQYPYIGVLLGGKLHWLMKDRDYIESFDLSSEVFERIELPGRNPGKSLFMREEKGRLTVIAVDHDGDGDGDGDGDDKSLLLREAKGRLTEKWVRVRVTKGGAKEQWVQVKAGIDEELKIIGPDYYGETCYVESLVWSFPLKNH